MKNIYESEEYKQMRQRLDTNFTSERFKKVIGRYTYKDFSIVIESYSTKLENGPNTLDVTLGVLYYKNEVIMKLKRNYHSFPYGFITHTNGNVYLLCGIDYQGYTIVDCTNRKAYHYIPERALQGMGFCWASIETDEDEPCESFIVEGCYWGASYETVEYDFSNPDVLLQNLPLPELNRYSEDADIMEEEEEE